MVNGENFGGQWLMNPLLERISIDPNVCSGKPCIRGTRIWLSLILDFLADGMTMDEIMEEYPQLTVDDTRRNSISRRTITLFCFS